MSTLRDFIIENGHLIREIEALGVSETAAVDVLALSLDYDMQIRQLENNSLVDLIDEWIHQPAAEEDAA